MIHLPKKQIQIFEWKTFDTTKTQLLPLTALGQDWWDSIEIISLGGLKHVSNKKYIKKRNQQAIFGSRKSFLRRH